MKLTKRFFICSALILFAAVLPLQSCGQKNKYFTELGNAYTYNADSRTFVKYPSELMFEPDEILIYSPLDSGTLTAEYQTFSLTLEKHDHIAGSFYDYTVDIAYTVQNNALVLANTPGLLPPYEYFIPGSSTDSLIITVGDENAYSVDLTSRTAQKLFNDADFESYFSKSSIKNLVFARVISVSPDGKYILYISNRDYIDDSQHNSFDLYCYDMHTGRESHIMNFNDKEVLTWDKEQPDGFLYRELITSGADGARSYSPIYRHSFEDGRQYIFMNLNEKYRVYDMADDDHIYILRKGAEIELELFEGSEEIIQKAALYVANIYTKEIFSVDPGKYTEISEFMMSETQEYFAFWGSHVNRQGIMFTELVTIHTETNDIVAHYEQNVGNYFIDSFCWLPDNILAVNFIDLTDINKGSCRLHKISHYFSPGGFYEPATSIEDLLDPH
ncbi:MAG: hypothetical protein FWH24_04850 [Oscillospiraceae bacterium]|nr:hypothetical protein [Oscillospiraceae bacterium]